MDNIRFFDFIKTRLAHLTKRVFEIGIFIT